MNESPKAYKLHIGPLSESQGGFWTFACLISSTFFFSGCKNIGWPDTACRHL